MTTTSGTPTPGAPRSGRSARRLSAGAAIAGSTLAAVLLMPGVALGSTPPPEPPADADASCDTAPTSYPANGGPVPAGASCAVVTTPTDVPVAEVWVWSDDTGLHWYNYLAVGYTDGAPGLTMCATEDSTAAGLEYECSTDSYFLLFTMPNRFVTWPFGLGGDLHYCESVDVVGPDAVPVVAHACGVLSASTDGESEPPPPPSSAPTQPPPTSEPSPPAEQPTSSATASAPEASDPAEESTAPTGGSPGMPDTPPEEIGAAEPAPSGGTAPGNSADAVLLDPAPGATPVESQSVALVAGAAFPVALMLAIAAALGLGGVAVLAGPGAFAAVRQRRR